MSTGTRSAWAGRGSGLPDLRQLEAAMALLRRARWTQTLVEYQASGLCLALFAASALVLAIRLGWLDWRAAPAVTITVVTAAIAAGLVAWRQRPRDLSVAIDADVKLNLKQRMSTAWELFEERGEDELTRRLARQAVRARLPARSALVFPLRVNGLGLAAPVGLILLGLVSIVDLPSADRGAAPAVDASVVSEGLRLREYGLRMEARARRETLPRSEPQAKRLQRLGQRMHAGTLSRERALERLWDLDRELDAERRAALENVRGIDAGPLSARALGGSASERRDAARMLRRLAEGTLSADDLRALRGDSAALDAAGIAADDLERALEALGAGDDRALREMLERLARAQQGAEQAAQRGARDAEELRRARERLARAREQLGDGTPPADGTSADTPARARSGAPASDAPDAPLPDGAAEEDAGGGAAAGRSGDRRDPGARPPGGAASGDGPALEADARIGAEGEVFNSEVRALPRVNARDVTAQPLAPQFREQVEAVLANERYPTHYKDYIRRYFLGLSQGTTATPANDSDAPPPGAR